MALSASELEADLCILGTGVAGMLLAERAVAHGRQVTMIERGTPMTFQDRLRQKSHADPLPFNTAPPFHPHDGPGGLYQFTPVYNLGGSTNHFFGNMPRFHPSHFTAEAFAGSLDRRWPITYAELEPYYVEAEKRLRISGNSERLPFPGRFEYPLPPHRLSPMDRSCEAIFGAEHVMQVPTVRPSQAVDNRPACCGSNHCMLCPVDSKGTALNTVYPSIRERVTIQTGWLATEIQCRGDRVERVQAVDDEGRQVGIRARQFVVACNGVDSVMLLQRSPGVPKHASLGRYYMDHPDFDLAIFGTGLDARPGYADSAQTGMVTAFFEKVADDLPVSLLGEIKSPILAGNQGTGARDRVVDTLWSRSILSGGQAALRARFTDEWRSLVYVRFLVETLPLAENTVAIDHITPTGQAIPRVRIKYPDYFGDCTDRVTAYIRKRLPGADVQHIMNETGVEHWLGAARMAEQPGNGCVDPHLRYHDMDNLFVLSGATFPSCSSANPTITIAALALRLGDRLKAA